jgi:hypothetical protein
MVNGALAMSGPAVGGKYEEVPVSAKLPAVVGARQICPEAGKSARSCIALQRSLVGGVDSWTLQGAPGADTSGSFSRAPRRPVQWDLDIGGRHSPEPAAGVPGAVPALSRVCHPRSGSALSIGTNGTFLAAIFFLFYLTNLLP